MTPPLLRRLPRLSVRLLAFNVLIVLFPVAGMLFLGTYEQHLLEAQERTMGQEGRLLAAALEANARLDGDDARRILVHLGQRHLARLRVVDRAGQLLADSAALGPRREPSTEATDPAPESALYRLGSLPFRLLRGPDASPPAGDVADPYTERSYLDGAEIRDALSGRYGATTRVTAGTTSLFLAIPVRVDGEVAGAVLVSQSTSRILSALHAVRLDVFMVFLAGLAVAVVLSLILGLTIVRPLNSLRRRAEAIVDRRGRLRGSFPASDRRDEVGDLERALAELTRRLEDHLRAMESFAADVAHEVKNPLGSIRSAAEVLLDEDQPEQRLRFLTMIQGDVARIERLLSGAREASRIDVQLEEEERRPVVLDDLLTTLVEGFRLRLGDNGPRLLLAVATSQVVVTAASDRLIQVVENLVDNAVGFSPPGGTIRVSLASEGGWATVVVADEGPGVPVAERERIFARFYTYRPDAGGARDHLGLGLAVVKAITEAYGGRVTVGDRPGGGAQFTVTLPVANC